MRNGKYGVAVWGCGWVASGHINAYLKNPHCEIVALGSRTLQSIQAKQKEFGLDCLTTTQFQQLLDNPAIDIISLCTPNNQHAPEAILAAQAGKHLFIEKPIGITQEEIRQVQQALQKSKIHTVVGLIRRFDPIVQLQRRLVQEGELGQVFMTNVDYWFGRERGGWMKHQEQTGSAFLLGGCHSIDMARYVTGADIVKVSAQAARVGDYYEYPSVETAQVTFSNGALGVVTVSLVGTNPFTSNITLLGEKGTIVNDKFYLKRFAGQTDYFTIDTGTKKSGDVTAHPFPQLVNHFIQCLQEDKESEHNFQSAINSHLACIAMEQSAKNNGITLNVETSELPL